MFLTDSTASNHSSANATTGDDCMNQETDGKKGLSAICA
jgi:hypothetical protein